MDFYVFTVPHKTIRQGFFKRNCVVNIVKRVFIVVVEILRQGFTRKSRKPH